MAAAVTADGGAAAPPPLPPALAGLRFEFESAVGRLACYTRAPSGADAAARPLLLIHSINASATAYEVKPLYDHYTLQRPVYAVDLPGFGFSDRSDRPYTLRLMTDAVVAVTEEIARRHPQVGGIDALAVSLSTEFLARAAAERPALFRSVALVSPTGLNRRTPATGAPGSSRGLPWLHRLLTKPFWTRGIYRNLTRPGVIRFFLKKTWGSDQIDEGLLAYDILTAQQPGARHAPLYFVSAFLFSGDATQVYEALRQPVWMVHGTRGDFTDYRYAAALAGRPNWHFTVLQTGALPYFEVPADFARAYDGFLAACDNTSECTR